MKGLSSMVIALFLVSPLANAAGEPQWAWTAGKVTSDGSVVVKSKDGLRTYNTTQNPTAASVRVNQNAATQPPLIIMQKTSEYNRWSMYYQDRAVGLP